MSDQYQDMGEKPDIEAQRVVSSEPVVTVTAAELNQWLSKIKEGMDDIYIYMPTEHAENGFYPSGYLALMDVGAAIRDRLNEL